MPFVTLWQALFAVGEIMKGFMGGDDTDTSSDGVEKVYLNLVLPEFSKRHTKITIDFSSARAT